MKFESKQQKDKWLKDTALKLKQMELERIRFLIQADFEKVVSLHKGIKLAKLLIKICKEQA